ncbi:hypothetical protein ADL02_03715 [Streptomyces sp. NRRL WC-3723]|nr:hypothetical protein ADL02_03715 [Streptomyces sp. NRRL WC-3723]
MLGVVVRLTAHLVAVVWQLAQGAENSQLAVVGRDRLLADLHEQLPGTEEHAERDLLTGAVRPARRTGHGLGRRHGGGLPGCSQPHQVHGEGAVLTLFGVGRQGFGCGAAFSFQPPPPHLSCSGGRRYSFTSVLYSWRCSQSHS